MKATDTVFWAYLWGIETCNLPVSASIFGLVLSLPMRNWNLQCWLRLFGGNRFWAYLWGIETFRYCWQGVCGREFWAYLWGIETSFHCSFCTKRLKFWAYLWGIETLYCIPAPSHFPQVLSLPMRNWNSILCPKFPYSEFSFEPTYEELKLPFLQALCHVVNQFWAYLWGIETSLY